MKGNFKFYFTILIVFLMVSCKPKYFIESNKENEVTVIKFMGSITTYSKSIGETEFWLLKNEHAKLIIENTGFIDDLMKITNHSRDDFKEYKYAFIVKNRKQVDTLYSDYSLKSWILKKNKKETYFFDKSGEIAENLRHSYSFFYDCW
jgi:hypothetical protein